MAKKGALQRLNLVLAVILTIISAAVIMLLLEMDILPDLYVTIIGLGAAVWDIILMAVAGGHDHGRRDVLTAVITVLLIAAVSFGGYLVWQLHQTMMSIFTAADETADAETGDAEAGDAETGDAETGDAEETSRTVTLSDDESVFIVYISGIDVEGEIEETISRSDVNILAVVNTDTGTVQLINTPRDYYVLLPSKGSYDKLTHAGLYGVECSMETLEYLYDIEIDYYVRINFTGFETLIDAIGGIDIYIEESFTSNDDIYFEAGWNHLDGELALSYARERKAFTSGDIQRGQNQMQVIEAIADQMLSSGLLLTNFVSLLSLVADMVQTDMQTAMIYRLIRYQLTTDTEWTFSSYTVTGTGASRHVYSASGYLSVVIPDESTVEEAKELIQAALSGESAAESDDAEAEY